MQKISRQVVDKIGQVNLVFRNFFILIKFKQHAIGCNA